MDVIKKCGLFVALFALSFTVLFGSYSASAASPYDGVVKLTDKLVLTKKSNGEVIDYSTTWYSEIQAALRKKMVDDNRYTDASLAFDRMLGNENAAWFVLQGNVQTGGTDGIVAIFTENSTGCTFGYIGSSTPGLVCSGSPVYRVTLSASTCGSWSTANCNVIASVTPISSYQQWIMSNTSIARIFIGTFDINYPDGYEGTPVPDTFAPKVTSKFAPDWVATKYQNFKVDFADNNFFTIDSNPFLCGDDGFAPIIQYTITNDNDGTLIDEGQFSASSNLSYQFEKVPERRDYTITGQYSDCEGVDFSESSSYTFMFNEAGGQHLPSMLELCFSSEFPYLTLDTCVTWFENILNSLSFGTLKFANDWSFEPQCRSLVTLGNWFQAGNTQLCPQVPAYVRNVVTPFITFALGLVTIRFLSRVRDGDQLA